MVPTTTASTPEAGRTHRPRVRIALAVAAGSRATPSHQTTPGAAPPRPGLTLTRRVPMPAVSEPVCVHGHADYARDLSGHFGQPLWLPVDGAGGPEMSLSDPCLIRSRGPSGEAVVRLGMTLQAQHDAASKGQDHEPTSSTDSPPASGRRSIMSSDRPDHMHSADARELFLAATSPASPHDEPVSASAGTFFRLRAPSRSLAGQRGNPPTRLADSAGCRKGPRP
jgi:hypothetical protein